MHRLCYNSSSTRCLCFPFAFISPTLERWPCGVLSACMWFLKVGSVCVRVCGEGGQAQKIPLKQICIGFQCYSRLSGTLVQMYLSMSAQTVENKLIFYSPSPLIPPLLLIFFPRCHSASISVLHASFSPFRHAIARTKIVLKFILCVLFSWQY